MLIHPNSGGYSDVSPSPTRYCRDGMCSAAP